MRVALYIAKKAGISRYHQLLKEEHAIQLKALMNELLPGKELLGLHPNIIGGRIFTIHDSCYTNHVSDIRIGLRKATDSLDFFVGEHVEEFFKKGYIDLLPFCLLGRFLTIVLRLVILQEL